MMKVLACLSVCVFERERVRERERGREGGRLTIVRNVSEPVIFSLYSKLHLLVCSIWDAVGCSVTKMGNHWFV